MKMSLHTPARSGYDEGPLTKGLERQTAVPTDAFLWAAFLSILGSLTLQFAGRPRLSLFVGQWAPTFLLVGVYHKLAKGLGVERSSDDESSYSER